jgi:beta-lactamase class A
VYFRDLGSGPWFGLNEEEEFSVASLFKVPIMMALLKHAESNPQILVQTLGYTGQTPGLENVTDADKTVLPGHYYSVDELLRRMIVYSDNISKELVKARLDAIDPAVDELHQTYKDLGLIGPDDTLSAKLTVKQYSSLFRILYNGFYLNKEMSQKALDLLSQAEFKDGLVAGVPTGVRIAHKFGIREDGQDKQLHDCGIVYDPLTPYLICIMTRSDSFQNNAMAIQNISRMVYDEVMERNRESMIKEGV